MRCFRCFVLPVLEYCSEVWCSAADTYLGLLDRVVNGIPAGGVLERNFSEHQSVVVVCMLYKIRSHRTIPYCGALSLPSVQCRLHVLSWSLEGILMHLGSGKAHSNVGLLYLTQYNYETMLVAACSKVYDWQVSMIFCWHEVLSPILSFTVFYFSSSFLWFSFVGWGRQTDTVHPLSPSLVISMFFNINNNNNNNNENTYNNKNNI